MTLGVEERTGEIDQMIIDLVKYQGFDTDSALGKKVVACVATVYDSVPDNFQYFNMLSYLGQGKYSIDKARRILGFEPRERWSDYFRRPT